MHLFDKGWNDVWGTDRAYNHMAVGWTWAFDTPFTWTKQIASHFDGTLCRFSYLVGM